LLLRFICKPLLLEARPAGFEPALHGLEVLIGTFATVHQGLQMLTNEPNPGYGLSPMFTGVQPSTFQEYPKLSGVKRLLA
jgi:hypothetical protein